MEKERWVDVPVWKRAVLEKREAQRCVCVCVCVCICVCMCVCVHMCVCVCVCE